MLKIDLGCGAECKKDYVGLDKVDFGQKMVCNIADGIPLEDDTVDEIHSSHFVEHLDEREIDILFHEMLRICKIGTKITITCPHSSQKEAYYLSHLTLWNELRVEGIVDGIMGWRGNKHMSILEIRQTGMELQFKLQVC